VVEHARHCADLDGANSIELAPETDHPVISLMEEQKMDANLGGTMRLGAFDCHLTRGSRSAEAYGADMISERHRHRFEFNDAFRSKLEDTGLVIAGVHQDSGLVEVVERSDHPWFVGCQFHPEFKSRPGEPHPLFRDFIAASIAARATS
jgi:CTP synthase